MTARILVADDEDGLRWVLEKGLRQAGYEVVAVKDGTSALEAFEAEPFDVVFLDVRMPGVDGLTALGRLREIRGDACVVVMTAHGTMDTAIQAMQRGAYDYLGKPFDLDEVLLLTERALTARRLTQEVMRLKSGLQAKLLRALQERTIERVGGQDPIRIDVRVLAATNRDLEVLMKDGRFREDLYYRLNVVSINLPPLRERRRDVPLLIEHLLAKHAGELGERGLAPDALDRLVGYDWPGNVRELENVIQRAMVMASSGIILPEHLPIGPVSAAASVTVDAPLEEVIERKLVECVRGLREHASANLYDLMIGLVEKPLLRAVLRETAGNQVRAAQILGINRNTLRKKLTEHGIEPDSIEG